MNQQPVYVFAKWQIKDGQSDTVLSILTEVSKKSREEEGNLIYNIHQSNSAKNSLMLYEVYKDESAVAAHRSSEHFQTMVIGQIVPLLENREVVVASLLF